MYEILDRRNTREILDLFLEAIAVHHRTLSTANLFEKVNEHERYHTTGS